jgi:hypothetical protein
MIVDDNRDCFVFAERNTENTRMVRVLVETKKVLQALSETINAKNAILVALTSLKDMARYKHVTQETYWKQDFLLRQFMKTQQFIMID